MPRTTKLSELDIRERARLLIARRGVNQAAVDLGVSRNTCLGLAAGAPVQRATFALVRAHLAGDGDE